MGIFGNAFSGWHALIILVVVVLLFGAAKLPALAKSVGQSMKIFKNEVRSPKDEAEESAVPNAPAGGSSTSEAAEPNSKS